MAASSLSPIRVGPGGRYFETFDGKPFLFIGPNDAISWHGLNGLYVRRDLDSVDVYLSDLAEHGVTVLRLMLEYCQNDHRYFERPVGEFNPAMVRFGDDLFARCEQFGLRVLLGPWDNIWMARRFHHHPYNARNGGPAIGPGCFFTNEAVIEATIRRFRFVIQRWGGKRRSSSVGPLQRDSSLLGWNCRASRPPSLLGSPKRSARRNKPRGGSRDRKRSPCSVPRPTQSTRN